MTRLEGSLSNAWLFAKIAGFKGVRNVWPWPSVEAWAIIGAFGALQALLQLALPGKEHKGPVSPKGNVPVYKVCCALACYASGFPMSQAVAGGLIELKVLQHVCCSGEMNCQNGMSDPSDNNNCLIVLHSCSSTLGEQDESALRICRQMECRRM